jgi:hypothetical protein
MTAETGACDFCAYYAALERAEAPRTLSDITADALDANCGHCWAEPGNPCDTPGGTHLARYARARRRGLISGPDMSVALDAADDVFEPATVVAAEAVPA